MVALRKQRVTDSSELPPMVVLSPEESKRQFDELARENLGMSGDEFILKLKAGEFLNVPDDEEHRVYVELALMSGVE